MRKVAFLLAFAGLFFLVSCDKESYTEDFQITPKATGAGGNNGGFGTKPDPNGRRDTITARTYWKEHVLTFFLRGLSPDEITYVQTKNVATGFIYVSSDPHFPAAYVPVVDDIDVNPIWREVTITFNAGFDPHQFLSYAEVDAALHAGEISIVETDRYYRYTLVGKG